MEIEPGWRPYTDGDWVFSDDFGWTFTGDSDWAWAVYHYGRWLFDRNSGWLWVPGYTRGPAWVAWRYGGGYIGWAPLPPDIAWDMYGGFGPFDWEGGFNLGGWVFCEENWFVGRDARRHLEVAGRNDTLFRGTKNVTDYSGASGRVMNRSLKSEMLERDTGRKIDHVRISDLNDAAKDRRPQFKGEALELFRPKLEAGKGLTTPRNVWQPRSPEQVANDQERLQKFHIQQQEKLQSFHESERNKYPNDAVMQNRLNNRHDQEMGLLLQRQQQEMRIYQNRRRRN